VSPTNTVYDPEVDDPPPVPTALQLRRPDIPVTLSELAARKGEALEIIEARVLVLETLRRASIRATSPEDWVLFKSPDDQGGQIIGYLQDAGADRIRDLYGIEIFNVSAPEKVAGFDAGTFHYLIRGSGHCKLTKQTLEDVEGGRSSTDDFCRGKKGVELELAVRKAARANLDGNITRELAGLKSVPLEEIKAGWVGMTKDWQRCRRGRGFGSRDERLGATREGEPDVEPPKCAVCGTVGKFRTGKNGRPDFYGCPNYEKHPDRKWIVEADKWIAEQKAKATSSPQAAAPANGQQPPATNGQTQQTQTRPRRDPREPGMEG
jgi:hypothetical protein